METFFLITKQELAQYIWSITPSQVSFCCKTEVGVVGKCDPVFNSAPHSKQSVLGSVFFVMGQIHVDGLYIEIHFCLGWKFYLHKVVVTIYQSTL